MYNLNLNEKEEILIISDNSLILVDKSFLEFTVILTNKRFLVLDYAKKTNNSAENLRIARGISYVKTKEIIFEKDLKNIKKIEKQLDCYKIYFEDESYISIQDDNVISHLLKML